MDSRERVRRTLTFQNPDRAPRDLWLLGQIPLYHAEELARLLERYPLDFANAPLAWASPPVGGPPRGQTGEYTDEWGVTFKCLEVGVRGEVTQAPLADWSALGSYTPPYDVLEGLDIGPSHAFYRETSSSSSRRRCSPGSG